MNRISECGTSEPDCSAIQFSCSQRTQFVVLLILTVFWTELQKIDPDINRYQRSDIFLFAHLLIKLLQQVLS